MPFRMCRWPFLIQFFERQTILQLQENDGEIDDSNLIGRSSGYYCVNILGITVLMKPLISPDNHPVIQCLSARVDDRFIQNRSAIFQQYGRLANLHGTSVPGISGWYALPPR